MAEKRYPKLDHSTPLHRGDNRKLSSWVAANPTHHRISSSTYISLRPNNLPTAKNVFATSSAITGSAGTAVPTSRRSPASHAGKYLRPLQGTAEENSIHMATDAQIAANRKNAQKSTGPRSDAGRARVSRNATRHGLCNTLPVMSDEDRPQMELILNNLNEEHQPDGMTEIILVYKMALNFLSCWRANILLAERLDLNDQHDESKQVALMLRYANTADRAFNRNLSDFRKLKKEREKEEIGFVVRRDKPA